GRPARKRRARQPCGARRRVLIFRRFIGMRIGARPYPRFGDLHFRAALSRTSMEHEYITTRDGLARAVERLRRSPILGVDTEAAGYHRYHDRISLLQFSTREENFLIDPLEVPDLSLLGEILSSPA